MTDYLRGQFVRLAALDDVDAPVIARWRQDGALLRLFDAEPAAPQSEAQVRKWLAGAREGQSRFLFGIRLLGDDRLIGHLELDGILWSQRNCWISVIVGEPDDRGKGYGGEALRLALRFAFHELNLHRVQLTVFSSNPGAIRVYERLGFTHEGTYREFLHRDGDPIDMLLYGLLRREWQEGLRAEG